MIKPFAAFDVDGTIFKSSLTEKAIAACIDSKLFAPEAFNEVSTARDKWQQNNSEGTYLAYLTKLVGAFVIQMTGIEAERLYKAIEPMITEQSARKYSFARELISALEPSHHIIAISGSPDIIVKPFLAKLPIQSIYGSTFEIKDGKFTGIAQPVGDKSAILASLAKAHFVKQAGSVAVGDTMSDKQMLSYAETAIMFNPSKTLKDYGAEFGWPIVYEIKDNITALALNAEGTYQEVPISSIINNLGANN